MRTNHDNPWTWIISFGVVFSIVGLVKLLKCMKCIPRPEEVPTAQSEQTPLLGDAQGNMKDTALESAPGIQENALPPLPQGWQAIPDPETAGNFYYYNTMTNTTTWDRPCVKHEDPEQGKADESGKVV